MPGHREHINNKAQTPPAPPHTPATPTPPTHQCSVITQHQQQGRHRRNDTENDETAPKRRCKDTTTPVRVRVVRGAPVQ